MEVEKNILVRPITGRRDNFHNVSRFPGQDFLGDFENLHYVGEAGDDEDVPKETSREKTSRHDLNKTKGVLGARQREVPGVQVAMRTDGNAEVVGVVIYFKVFPMH